jgi:hypothetical protein
MSHIRRLNDRNRDTGRLLNELGLNHAQTVSGVLS